MTEFKVGDKVRVLRGGDDAEYWNCYEEGDILEITDAYNSGDYKVGHQIMHPNDIEHITQESTLTVGKTYTSANGDKWECIAVNGDTAWMADVYSGGVSGVAYQFHVDGTPVCLLHQYRIVFVPERKTVACKAHWFDGQGDACLTNTGRAT